MKIGDTIYTNKNGCSGLGIIIDSKTITYMDKKITIFKIKSEVFGTEWINAIYLKKVM